jgi:hypothetical protein
MAADRTVCTFIQVTWHRSGMLTGQMLLTGGRITFGHVAYLWANEMVPRGPIMGCHVVPLHWLALGKIIWTPQESNP